MKRRLAPAPAGPPTHFGQTLTGLDGPGLLALAGAGRAFEQVRFVGCELGGADLRSLRFADCLFEHSSLAAARLGGAGLQNVAFAHCKLLGVPFSACQGLLLALHFGHCQLGYASFAGLRLAGTRFAHCTLAEADFTNADLRGAVFADCDLSRAVFHDTDLTGADLRTARHLALDPEANRLAGARLALASLPGLLGKYGLEVE